TPPLRLALLRATIGPAPCAGRRAPSGAKGPWRPSSRSLFQTPFVERVMFSNLFTVAALSAALAFAGPPAPQAAPKNCCGKKLTCCAKDAACCKAGVKEGCCAQGKDCCKAGAGCCVKPADCCTRKLRCCNKKAACCKAAVKEGCCSRG